ncbi:unnamed protein product [Toxocara canis]|uniref:Uncharacterized protein n=1 Tax=Toxocara canis TaxID=6265 RepID=A0A183UEH7_TOXCA|nr:unnamed protein product [Toxocara canis]
MFYELSSRRTVFGDKNVSNEPGSQVWHMSIAYLTAPGPKDPQLASVANEQWELCVSDHMVTSRSTNSVGRNVDKIVVQDLLLPSNTSKS